MRTFCVATAAYPWLTGTAINPLLRAAWLGGDTILLLPWIGCPKSQKLIYHTTYKTHVDQERVVSAFLKAEAPEQKQPEIRWYAATYHPLFGSILPHLGAVNSATVDVAPDDICIVEEPSKFALSVGDLAFSRFRLVVGIVHTNYKHYAADMAGAYAGWAAEVFMRTACTRLCDKVLKLSAAIEGDVHHRQEVACVNGVRYTTVVAPPPRGRNAYFIGKLVLSKGFGELFEAWSKCGAGTLTVFGDGPHKQKIKNMAKERNVVFGGRLDHAALPKRFGVLVNASKSEVVCTVTMEALTMGRVVVCPKHPSNAPFAEHPNCIQYDGTVDGLVEAVVAAQTFEPSEDARHMFSWKNATAEMKSHLTSYPGKRRPVSTLFHTMFQLAAYATIVFVTMLHSLFS